MSHDQQKVTEIAGNYYSKIFNFDVITKVTLQVYRYSFIPQWYNEFLLLSKTSHMAHTELTETGDLLLIFRLIISLYSDSLWGTWASGDTHKVYYLQLYIIYF